MKREILLVDDDRLLLESLGRLLAEAGYAVRTARDGDRALREIRRQRPDLLLLDVSMSRMCGLEVCRRIRETDRSLPIVFLTALESPADELKGLSSGGDLYIPKSTADEVLLARLAAVMRPREEVGSADSFDFRGWRIEGAKLTARSPQGRIVALTEREVLLLRLFAMHPGEVFGRDALFTRIWGVEASPADNSLSALVYNVRRKLGHTGVAIEAVRGVGYVFRP